ncbi:MAG: lamin tail domain-containing protein [Solirubrobacterales bacterium]|nr:lamin tail domain-containing protein [Solirubrobacterales bacterium]
MIVVISVTAVSAGQAEIGHAPPRRDVGGALAPVTFTSTGAEQAYTVPEGVTSLEIQAVGANGGSTNLSSPAGVAGGTGGLVTGEVAVGPNQAIKPGQTLYVEVGGNPTGERGGFNGGGSAGGDGSGGGGASDVRTCSRTSGSCPNGAPNPLTRLIVAAGGGGAGSCGPGECDLFAGTRGSAGQSGGDSPLAARTGGGAGTLLNLGSAGVSSDAVGKPGGADGMGGNGGGPLFPVQGPGGGGGGGGAGYFGGGGGGVEAVPQDGQYGPASGGGGGGANFASPLAVSNAVLGLGDGTPRIVITPQPASAIQITRIYYNSPGPDTGGNKSLNAEWVRLRNTGGTTRQLRGWSISDDDGHVYRFGSMALPPGASVTVHTGRGRDTASDRYWNRRRYMWDNKSDVARLHRANGALPDQCGYDNPNASEHSCAVLGSPADTVDFRVNNQSRQTLQLMVAHGTLTSAPPLDSFLDPRTGQDFITAPGGYGFADYWILDASHERIGDVVINLVAASPPILQCDASGATLPDGSHTWVGTCSVQGQTATLQGNIP